MHSIITEQREFQSVYGNQIHSVDEVFLFGYVKSIFNLLCSSVFFGIDECVGDGGVYKLPHTFPTEAIFDEYAGKKGLKKDDAIVVYDSDFGVFSAPRVWFMFKVFGASNIGILKGGLNAYLSAGLPVHNASDPISDPMPQKFGARLDASRVKSLKDVLEIVTSEKKSAQIVDARSDARFHGTIPEPRPGLLGGHIPGAKSVPYDSLLDPDTKTIRKPEQLRDLFASKHIDGNVITSCGSGVTACSIIYGLHLTGNDQTALYDGSWSEWGLPSLGLPIEK